MSVLVKTRLSDTKLRSRLVRHREERLVPFYPNVPRDRGILRRTMLDVLVAHRPVSLHGFYMIVPPRLLAAIDSVQLREEIDEVLEIIRYS